MKVLKELKKLGQYAALVIGLGLSAAPVKAEEPIKHRQELNLELKSLEDKVADYNESEFIDIEKHFEEESTDPDYKHLFLALPANIITGYATKLFWHEAIGHALTAKYLGCEGIEIHGPSITYGSIASTSFIPKELNDFELNLINAAGTEATTNAGLALYEALKNNKVPESIKPWAATTSFLMLLDRHQYILGTVLLHYLGKEIHGGNDFHSIMTGAFEKPELEGFYSSDEKSYFINGIQVHKGDILRWKTNDEGKREMYKFIPYVDKEGRFRKFFDQSRYKNMRINGKDKDLQKKLDIAYSIAAGMSILELGLRHKEIAYLVGTALGGNPEPPEGYEIFKTGFYPIPNGFFISIDGTF